MSLGTLLQKPRAPPDKCTVYWDYENQPIPKKSNLTEILSTLKDKLWTLIGTKLPIEFKVYIRASKLTPQIQNDFDINGIVQIQIPSKKPESVDKRLMIDMAFSLYELERDNKSRVIALISGDRDFGHLLSKIHHQPPIANSFLILLRRAHIDKNLSNVVDHVIQLNYADYAGKNAGDNTYVYTHAYEEKISKRDRNNRDRDRYKIFNENKSNLTKQITIHITNLMDLKQTFEFKTTLTNQTQNLKHAIFNRNNDENANIQQLTLLFKGKEIKTGENFTKCGITNGDTLRWYFDQKKKIPEKNSSKICLKFQNLNSNQTFEINTTKNNYVANLRHDIYVRNRKLNIAKEQFILYYQETELMDHKRINSYNIIDGDTLIWYTDENRSDKNINKKQKKKKNKNKNKRKIILTLQHETSEFNNIKIESTLVNQIANIIFILKQKLDLNSKQENIVIKFKSKILNKKDSLKKCGITDNVILSWKIFDDDPMYVLQLNPDHHDKDMSKEVVVSNSQLIDDNEFEKKQSKEKECEVKKITVIVKNEMNKATLLFTMSKTDSLLDLKGMIEKRLAIHKSDQILMFNGKLLENKNEFDDGDTIEFKVNVKAVIFDVQVLDGECIKDMRCWNNITVSDLKKEISTRSGLDATDQNLTYDGTEMIDSYYLYNYRITDRNLIKLTLK